MDNQNRIQLRRSTTVGNIPTLQELLPGELAVNMVDRALFLSLGTEVIDLLAATSLKLDANHQFVTQAEKDGWNSGYVLPTATGETLGGIKVGENLLIDGSGLLRVPNADGVVAGVLSAGDYQSFSSKQDALGYSPVNRAGDSMEGELLLAGSPVSPNGATTKAFVEGLQAAKLDKAGGTMTGDLVLFGDPLSNLSAVPKQYVDTQVNLVSGRYAAPVGTIAELSAIPALDRQDRQMRLVENVGAIYRYDAESTEAADGMGVIAPDDAPPAGRWFKVQAATQTHNQLVGLQGGAEGDYLHLTTAEKNAYDAHLTNADLHMTADQNAFLDQITATSAEVNYLSGVTSNIQQQLDGKQDSLGYTAVNKAGDTMVGFLTLHADPTAPMHAVTRQFVENMVIDGGTF